jgi:hypothetical protein
MRRELVQSMGGASGAGSSTNNPMGAFGGNGHLSSSSHPTSTSPPHQQQQTLPGAGPVQPSLAMSGQPAHVGGGERRRTVTAASIVAAGVAAAAAAAGSVSGVGLSSVNSATGAVVGDGGEVGNVYRSPLLEEFRNAKNKKFELRVSL